MTDRGAIGGLPTSRRGDIIVARDVHKWFGQLHVLRGIDLTVTAGEVVVIFGAVGLGQVDLHPDHQPARGAPARRDHRRRHRADERHPQHRRRPQRDRDGLPVVQPVPAPDRAPEHDPGADAGAQLAREPRPRRRHGAARAGGHPGAGAQVPGPAVGRPAAARRDRPGAGHAAQDHALRRADLGARPGDDQRGARRDARAGRRRA